MRTIKHPIYLLALLVLSLFSSCTKYDFVETGKATSYHDTTMWEYFQTDSYNWSYLVYMTKRAGLEDLFQGTNTQYGPEHHLPRDHEPQHPPLPLPYLWYQ